MQAAIDQLSKTPEILGILLDGLSEEEANWKPSPDRWSIAEVVEHLSHVEAHCFRLRLDQMLEQTLPHIVEYDQNVMAASGQYSGRDVEDSFDHWEDQRETNLEFLESLEESAFGREGRHETLGVITVRDLVNEWAFHDMGHIRQVTELIRSYRFYPVMGPLKSGYEIRP
jgi:hypothetical protein